MAAAQGFTEVYNYSFVTEEMARAFDMDPEAHLRVANPIASDQTLMRVSLLPAIRKNILENSRHFPTFRLFEIGREIHPRDTNLPEEIPHFAAAMYAREGDGSASLFELKRLAECLMPGCEVRQARRTAVRASGTRGDGALAQRRRSDVCSNCIRRSASKAAPRCSTSTWRL